MSITIRVIVCFAFMSATAVRTTASTPGWVDGLTNIRLPQYEPVTAAVCLLDENRTVVTEDGEIRDYHRVAYKILTREGLGLAWLRFAYNSETKVSELKAWNIKGAGVIHEASQKDAVETQLAGAAGALFEDTKSLILLVPQVDPGSIIAYEYERRHRPYVLQDYWLLQQHYPVLQSRVEIQLPPNWEFQYRVLRHANSEPREVAKNRWLWETTDLPAIPQEEGMPSLANLSALLVVTYLPQGNARVGRGETFRNWDDFASWTNRLNGSRFEPSNEMTEMARRLGTPKAVAEFVQQKVRYVAIEIGIGGYQPHLAQETFRNQYGDCKDKVTLLRGLMKVLNREVYPVLIDANRGGLVPEFPSPLYFNHMIAAIPAAEGEFSGSAIITHPEAGRLLLFDPTDENTSFGFLPSALQGTTAMLVRGDRGFLISTPVGNVVENRLVRTGEFRLNSNGALAGDFTDTHWGELAARETTWLKRSTRDQWIGNTERVLAGRLPSVQVKRFSVGGLFEAGPLQEQYSIEVPEFGEAAGELLLFRPASLQVPGQLPVPEESRTHPYQFSHVRFYSASLKFQIPEGYVVEALPTPEELDLPFARYRYEFATEGNTLRYSFLYQIKKLEVSAAEFGQLRDFYNLMNRTSRSVVLLKRLR